MKRRVVISGYGIYSCLGLDRDSVAHSLKEGKSGIILDPERKKMGYRSGLTGYVPPPELKTYLSRRMRVGMSEPAEYAYMSTIQALEQAKMDEDFFNQNEVGILFGNDSTSLGVINTHETLKEKKDTTLIGSGAIFQSMNSTVTMNLSTIFRITGINFTVSGACASGSHSVGLGYLLIQQGLQDIVICGGAQEINPHAMSSFDGLGAFSTREEIPEKASRPFDKSRDGLVPGGGAATLVLESYENAVKRGAPILGEVVGYGFSSNGAHISQPSVEGPERALKMALSQAGMDAGEIDYLNAHATATPVGDLSEARAIVKVFGENTVPVSSTKSMTGHECWMAGASELVYGLIMMQEGFIAPNINFEEADEETSKLNIISTTQHTKIKNFLSNSFGFGGTNSAIIIKSVG